MTYLFTCGKDQFRAIKEGSLSFDIDNNNIKVGDRIVYQEVDEDDKLTNQEHEVLVSFIYHAIGLKSRYISFQFKEKE